MLLKNSNKVLIRFLIIIKKEPVKIKIEGASTTDELSLFYNSKYSFIEFKYVGKYMDGSLVSIHDNYLAPFKQRSEEFKKFTPRKLKTKPKKRTVYNNTKTLYSKLLTICYDDYNNITDEEKKNRWVENIIVKIYF